MFETGVVRVSECESSSQEAKQGYLFDFIFNTKVYFVFSLLCVLIRIASMRRF